MADEQVHAVAKVHVELEVSIGPYGKGWALEDIMKQARREAPEKIQHMIDMQRANQIVRIVGEPDVDVVITMEKR